ncbi:hypothetical protein cypCar_00012244 [Cyprinus carpio]|nr:hypothetical protein cypCar_00012244 [Cyprinus carpio]
MTPTSATGMASGMELPRKRKGSMDNPETKSASNLEEDMEDDQGRSEGDDQHLKIKCVREPHSQIEKRRRDKMNNLIDELAAMIPTCNPMSRKLDKLTVLRMAVQHLKSLKGATSSFAEANYKPAFLPDDELKHLVLRDIGKVKEQLSASELYPRERLIDAKKSQRYCTVHCTGYMRTWPTRQLGTEGEAETDKESSHFSCLVAVGRVHPHTLPQANGEIKVKPTEFVTRYAMDGKFTFVDQRATTILGYLPQELLGTSCYEYFHLDDLPHLADRHRKVLRSKEKIETNCYKFKTKYGSFVTLQSQWFSFINPWTKEVEYIVSTNTVISGKSNPGGSGDKSEQPSSSKASEDDAKKSQQVPIIPGISSASGMIYAGCIGTQIANEIMDYNRMNSSPSSGNTSPFSVLQDKSPLALAQASSNLDLEGVPGLGALSTDEAAMAVIMSLLETDANLGEAVDFDEMHWSL